MNADDFASPLLEQARKLREAEEEAQRNLKRIAEEYAQLQREMEEIARRLEEMRNKPLP